MIGGRAPSTGCSDSGLSSLLSACVDDDDDDSILDEHLSRVWRSCDDRCVDVLGGDGGRSSGWPVGTDCGAAHGRRQLIAADDDATAALCDAVRRLEQSSAGACGWPDPTPPAPCGRRSTSACKFNHSVNDCVRCSFNDSVTVCCCCCCCCDCTSASQRSKCRLNSCTRSVITYASSRSFLPHVGALASDTAFQESFWMQK